MAQYENEFSNFPKKLITKHNYKNVDEISAPLINQINTLRSQGFYAQAAQILQNNKEILVPYIIDAVTFRTIEEEIYNTQKYAKQTQQSVLFEDEEPDYCEEEDIWLGV
ncbi:MAG: hypothetical protein HFI55_14960 [Lachnospiraceae bacterium]|jgi:hypothetical protein|nr:hypothetical protein [Lachnospiraceae bacterium]